MASGVRTAASGSRWFKAKAAPPDEPADKTEEQAPPADDSDRPDRPADAPPPERGDEDADAAPSPRTSTTSSEPTVSDDPVDVPRPRRPSRLLDRDGEAQRPEASNAESAAPEPRRPQSDRPSVGHDDGRPAKPARAENDRPRPPLLTVSEGGATENRPAFKALLTVACISAALVLCAGYLLAANRSSKTDQSAGQAQAGTPTPPAVAVLLTSMGTETSPVVWQGTPPRDRAMSDALEAYQVYLGVSVRLAESPNPDDAALPQVAVEPQLARTKGSVVAAKRAEESRRGRVVASAVVLSVRREEAVVRACVNMSEQRIYRAGEEPVALGTPISATVARLHWDDGQWKVAVIVPTSAAQCPR